VAELVAQRWVVPADAQRAELDAALRVLAGHFQLHSDAEAGETVPSRCAAARAAQPRADALQLRLVVRPSATSAPKPRPATAARG
jgi:hypothetical protein